MSETVRVSIIGGGCAAVATAFELTRPQHKGKYKVTIHQQGWRLGGKGASGRKAAKGERIEEHGLHLWMGFYENAFRMMRECYQEAARDPSKYDITTMEDAFKPDNFVGVTEQTSAGWEDWTALFPPAAGRPGDPLPGANPFSIHGYLTRCILMLRTLVSSAQGHVPVTEVKGGANLVAAMTELGNVTVGELVTNPVQSMHRAFTYGRLTVTAAVAEALDILNRIVSGGGADWRVTPNNPLGALLTSLSTIAHNQIDAMIGPNRELRRMWEIADVVLAIVRGILRDGLLLNPKGFEAIDDKDWSEWLGMHGASKASLNSAFIRASYDLLFAFKDGDVENRSLAAGQALRGAMRMFFTYRGALFWKMQAGMGDIVFAPFYEVLKDRGVEFRFFRRLDDISLGADKKHVAGLTFLKQAEYDGDYNPLKTVNRVPSWPADPDLTQLKNAAPPKDWNPESKWDLRDATGAKAKKETLSVGKDFDIAVLAVGLGEVPLVGKELIDASTEWKTMVETVEVVATQALQVWLKDPVSSLGWTAPPINISGFVEPFDTWADMRHLIDREAMEPKPGGIAYFCSVLPDKDYPSTGNPHDAARAKVRANAINFLNKDVGHFWPQAVTSAGFRWSVLAPFTVNDDTTLDESRIDSQFWTANVNPTDKYVLSLPGTLACRISPMDTKFDNLTVAGDWTACGHMAGCVESAVMSGQLAAHAISGAPRLEEIVGYDHP